MSVDRLARSLGKGILAGLAGTAAMTVSSTIEAKLRGRAFSTAPAEAAAKALGIAEFSSPEAKSRFSNLVHWGYGTGWGVLYGLLRGTGLPSKTVTPAHFATVWGSALVTLPKLDVAPPITMWAREDVAIDVWHHLVYSVTTGLAYELLD